MSAKECMDVKNEDTLTRDFRDIFSKAQRSGLSSSILLHLKCIACLRKKSTPSLIAARFRYSAQRLAKLSFKLSVVLLIALAVIIQRPLTFSELSTALQSCNVLGRFIKGSCLLACGESLHGLFRPPVDCNICREVKTVERVSLLSRQLFENRYAYTGRPVIVTDAMSNWTAVKTFSFEFFRSIYSNDSPALVSTIEHCQFFPYQTSFSNLSEVFNMDEYRAQLRNGSEPWYIGWSNCDGSAANLLRTHYTRPYFLPEEAESSKTDWIFMGSPQFGAHLHIDNVQNPSWQAQVSGTKKWTLEPPPECYFDCAARIETVVHPGEIIVLDTNQWFHSTLIIGNEMSITIGSEYD